ncbi:unnamed protein product, partial [Coregonus sp. 'balchen']
PEVFTLVVPHGPILTQINASISLPCELSPIFSAEPLEVCWYRPGNFNRPALLYKDHSIQASMDPRYWGRVSLTGGLERGNVSLRLERVTLEDRGEYVCHVSSEHWYEKAKVSLTLIVLGGIPVVSIAEARGSGGQVNVTCSSVGWSPQPTVTWRNKEGKEIRNGQEVLYTSVSLSEEKKRESRILPQICQPGPWREAFIAYLVLSLLLLSALASVVIMLGKQRNSLARLSSQKSKGSPDWLQRTSLWMPQTAHLAFNASDEGKKAQYSTGEANNSSNKHPHVLGKERLISGQHYWEVKMGDNCTEKLSWYIGVARENAQRKSTIPLTPQYGFWILFYEKGKGFHVKTTNPPKQVTVAEYLSIAGGFLDSDRQTLSFYNVETKSHLYTFSDVVSNCFLPVFSPGKSDKHVMIIC